MTDHPAVSPPDVQAAAISAARAAQQRREAVHVRELEAHIIKDVAEWRGIPRRELADAPRFALEGEFDTPFIHTVIDRMVTAGRIVGVADARGNVTYYPKVVPAPKPSVLRPTFSFSESEPANPTDH